MDRYAARGLIHKNKASRHKSRLTAHIRALDEMEEIEKILRHERLPGRTEASHERRALVEPAERNRGPERAAGEKVARDAEPPRDLEGVRRRRRGVDPVPSALRGTKTPGEPKRAECIIKPTLSRRRPPIPSRV